MKLSHSLVALLILPFSVGANALTDEDYYAVDLEEAKLGRSLFYDPILSGNRNISCATCHHPKFSTSDGVSLSLGEGGKGLGPERNPDPKNLPEQLIPRHAQTLFNLGAKEFRVLFHDGRIEHDTTKSSGLRTPMDDEMMQGFASLLSAQTMFPVLSPDEMAGHYSENDVSKAVRSGRITGAGGAWDILAKRVSKIEEYSNNFKKVYPDINVNKDIKFTHISDAIAAFISFEWRSDASPYDAYLRGENPLGDDAAEGLEIFQNRCANCHSGPFQTDHGFHAMGVPQFGPGKAARFENHAKDVGRMRVTGDPKDAYAFRTPSLRNVAKTAPYGHTGAYATLKSFLQAHGNPTAALNDYDRNLAILPKLDTPIWRVLDSPDEIAEIVDAIPGRDLDLNPQDIKLLIAFLETLSDPIALNGRLGIPDSVPSGLEIDR
ncbi:MAG: cytochrome c peroxidase [Litoreibacter sp.]